MRPGLDPGLDAGQQKPMPVGLGIGIEPAKVLTVTAYFIGKIKSTWHLHALPKIQDLQEEKEQEWVPEQKGEYHPANLQI